MRTDHFSAYLPPGPDALADKVVLITGASRGLGRALSVACAAHGAQILVLGRDVRRLEALADDIEAAGHHPPVIVPMNLEGATVDDYAAIAALIRERYGRLDGLVLNAAALGEMSPLENYDSVIWARVFQVNVHSQFLLLRHCLPLLRASGRASIVFVASSVGRRSRAYWGAYAVSKFASEGLMQTLADELGPANGVRVNSLNPRALRTRLRADAYPAEDSTALPEPQAVAPYFVYLLSEAATALHGLALDVPRVADC